MKKTTIGVIGSLLGLALASNSPAGTWSGRANDPQNSGNAGQDPGLTFSNVKDLRVVDLVATTQPVLATPVVTDGIMVVGDMTGKILVVDVSRQPAKVLLKIATGSTPSTTGVGKLGVDPVDKTGAGHLPQELGNYKGVQSTATLANVTLPGGVQELRAYVGANTNKASLWCISLDKVKRDRGILSDNPGDAYLCSGNDKDGNPAFPRTLSPEGFGKGNGTFNASPKFSPRQTIKIGGKDEVRDILFTPSTGLDCYDGRMWAMDALTGQILWDYDPVVNGNLPGGGSKGGTIWTTPALSRDKKTVYITTGDCVGAPQVGEKAESIVALDAASGAVKWFHQRRLIDTADLDPGTGPSVVDVDGFQGCHVVVSGDKDGCMYGYNQQADVPEVGDLGFDPLRMGQQRLLWRKCFVGGTLNGGFNASNGAVWDRYFVQQTSGYPFSHIGSDDSNAFAVDVCNGQVQWASSDISNGRTDAAIASDMLFQLGVTRKVSGVSGPLYQWMQEVTVVAMDSGLARIPEVLATVKIPAQGSLGGGGVAVADGTLFIPTVGGVAIARVVPGSNASAPVRRGLNVFAGPYPEPMAPGSAGSLPMANAGDPYPLMLRKPGAPEFFESLSEGGPVGVLPDGVVPETE